MRKHKDKTNGVAQESLRSRLAAYSRRLTMADVGDIKVRFGFPAHKAHLALLKRDKELREGKDPEWIRNLTLACLCASVQYEHGEPPLSESEWGQVLDAIGIEQQESGEKITAGNMFGDVGIKALTICGFKPISDALEGKNTEVADEVERQTAAQVRAAQEEIGAVPS